MTAKLSTSSTDVALHSITTLPEYTTTPIELANFRPSSSSSSLNDSLVDAPPAYSLPSAAAFRPTVSLQVQTPGKPLLSLPIPLRPDPIPIFEVSPSGAVSSHPRYVSVRPSRGSGSCVLIAGDDGDAPEQPKTARPLSSTTYRFGPGRHPAVALFGPGESAELDLDVPDLDGAEHPSDDNEHSWDGFALEPVGLLTRAVRFRTRLGTFEWRYARRSERRAIEANSLLVLERVVRVAVARNAGANSKDEEVRTPVAQFVRNAAWRSPGSAGSSAGNGGRLLVDLGLWTAAAAGGDEKVDREMALVLVVTTCIAMLKKEVDRRRAQQIAVMAAVTGGAH